MLQLIQEAALLIGTAAGAVTDAKTGYIYDWITYPMLAAGVILSVTQQQWKNSRQKSRAPHPMVRLDLLVCE